jgi:hypothetical protein
VGESWSLSAHYPLCGKFSLEKRFTSSAATFAVQIIVTLEAFFLLKNNIFYSDGD